MTEQFVTISTVFPHVTKPMERHDVEARRVKSRNVSRREMRTFLAETLEDLERCVCEFQFCPGPDKPTAAMQTCFLCYRIKRVRTMLGWLTDEEPPQTRDAEGPVDHNQEDAS